jgi:hypothetical protein
VREVLLIAGLLVFVGVFEEAERGFTCRFLRQIQQVSAVFQHALSWDIKSFSWTKEHSLVPIAGRQASMFAGCDRLL